MSSHPEISASTATAPATARRTKPAATVRHVDDDDVLEPDGIGREESAVAERHEPEGRRQL